MLLFLEKNKNILVEGCSSDKIFGVKRLTGVKDYGLVPRELLFLIA